MTAGGFDPRLTTYFGDATLQAGFLPLPNLFLRHYAEIGLSGKQVMFVVQLMATTSDLGSPPTTLSDIAGRMGIARRTAQSISVEPHAKGVLDIYDQYDDGGSQIENGYDLGPLSQRLAAFAPAPLSPGTQRQRRVRRHRQRMRVRPQRLQLQSCPLWQNRALLPGRKLHSPLAENSTPSRITRSRLPGRNLLQQLEVAS